MNGEDRFAFETAAYPGGKNAGLDVDVYFNSDNYKKAKELSQGKDYTFMIYMCGTDQEVKETYRRVSIQLTSMMQANVDNINVLLCVGGTTSYGNNYMNSDAQDQTSFGVSNLKSGIYYVNPKGLSDDVRHRLSQVDLSGDSIPLLKIFEGKEEDTKGITNTRDP